MNDSIASKGRGLIVPVMDRRHSAAADRNIPVPGQTSAIGSKHRQGAGRGVHLRPGAAGRACPSPRRQHNEDGQQQGLQPTAAGKAEKRSKLRQALLPVLALLALSGPRTAPAATFLLPTDGSTVIGEVKVVQPTGGNTLLDVARHFDVGYEEIVAANPEVSVWTPAEGARVVVPTQFILPRPPWRGIVINIPQRRLYYFPAAAKGQPRKVITYPISIAREGWSTPLGETRIVGKYKNPSWFVPKSIQAEHLRDDGVEMPEYFPPGPNNPMGMLAMRTGFPGIYIHGTNRPWGVGMRTSHGCIHLYPEDAAEIFPGLSVGTPVRVINEPLVTGNDRGRLVMASFEPVDEYPRRHVEPVFKVTEALQAFLPANKVLGGLGLIDWSRVDRLVNQPQPVPTALTKDQPDLDTRLGKLEAMPYDWPPYGIGANNALAPGQTLPGN